MTEQYIPLYDYGGTVNQGVDFQVKTDGSGIDLKVFELDGVRLTIEEVLQYQPWNFGKVTPGGGQMGIYRVHDPVGSEHFALVRDYRAHEGDWRIFLLKVTDTERQMKNELMMSPDALTFTDYLFR